jgi:hypothetical protein
MMKKQTDRVDTPNSCYPLTLSELPCDVIKDPVSVKVNMKVGSIFENLLPKP